MTPTEDFYDRECEKIDEEIKKEKDNIVYVGIKPFMSYIHSVVYQFNNLKEKGHHISKGTIHFKGS